jgi:hypothetical protein
MKNTTFLLALLLGYCLTNASVFAMGKKPVQQPSGTAPANWPNAYTASDGTIWSDMLPKVYANCISVKDTKGNPKVDSDGYVICQRDSYGIMLGASSDGKTLVDSDAIQACKAIGGELPTIEDFQNLGNHWQDLPNMEQLFWTTSLAPFDFGYPFYIANAYVFGDGGWRNC